MMILNLNLVHTILDKKLGNFSECVKIKSFANSHPNILKYNDNIIMGKSLI